MISVVIPSYKRPKLLDRLLSSISKQTFLPNEIIVIDDASNMDKEYRAVADKYKAIFHNLQYIVLEKNSGAPVARNIGINLSKNEWIALVDDDDEWLTTKLEKQIDLINKYKDKPLGLIYTWAKAIDSENKLLYESTHTYSGIVKKELLKTNFIMSASVIVNKQAILDAGLFNINFPSCQDWDMWLRIALKNYSIAVVPEVLTIYHRHGGLSIGLSSNAKIGYNLFLKEHWKSIVLYTSPINWAKKIFLYFKINSEINNVKK